jgi:hypothetical protein
MKRREKKDKREKKAQIDRHRKESPKKPTGVTGNPKQTEKR